MPSSFVKDPHAVLDYKWDWSAWLGTDTIDLHTLTGGGLVVEASTDTATTVTAWLSGGTAGTVYTVACKIVTAGGRTDERSILVQVDNK